MIASPDSTTRKWQNVAFKLRQVDSRAYTLLQLTNAVAHEEVYVHVPWWARKMVLLPPRLLLAFSPWSLTLTLSGLSTLKPYHSLATYLSSPAS